MPDPTPRSATEEQALRARERLVALRREARPRTPDLCRRVREVVVLASSSRGGSSVMAEILRHSPDLLHFRAEINLFVQLAGLGYPASGTGSDALEAGHRGDPALLEQLLALDAGRPARGLPDDDAVDAFAAELHWRLSAQWPSQPFDAGQVHAWTVDTLAELRREHGWGPGEFVDAQRFHALLLRRVRATHPRVNPWYYDLRPDLIERHCPDARPDEGPPSPFVFEEPPFVTVAPWAPAGSDAGDLDRPLVIKTPSNVYRLDLWRALFPAARFRVFHLTRNAAASINGLYDGWRFRGFFAHELPARLSLAGYSDRFPRWGDRWWKFDLPPGWEAWTGRSLVEVCGFQWRSAHRATLAWLDAERAAGRDPGPLRLRFEHTVGGRAARRRAFERLTGWLGIPLGDALGALVESGLPPIMATSRPRMRRWFDKAELLGPVLRDPATLETLEQLGYDLDPDTWT